MNDSIPANIAREAKRHAESKELKAGERQFYRIWQSGASPYSQKVMAFMNYKGIPYKKVLSNMEEIEWLKKSVGQSIVPVMMSPSGEMMQDSSPIMTLLEARFPEVPTIPEDPRLAFLMWLIEEFSDEYILRLIVHTRWGTEENRAAGSHRIARTVTYGIPHIDTQKLAPVVRQRQLGFDPHLGLSDDVRANMDQQLSDLLGILEVHFRHYQFLLGFRPTMADFAVYGFMLRNV
jgi:glutathione S-transferase